MAAASSKPAPSQSPSRSTKPWPRGCSCTTVVAVVFFSLIVLILLLAWRASLNPTKTNPAVPSPLPANLQLVQTILGAPQIYWVANKTCDNRALLRGTGFANDAQLDVFYTYQDAFQLGENIDRSRLIRETQFVIYSGNGFSVLLDPLARPEMQGFTNIYYVAEMPAYPDRHAGPIGLTRAVPPNGPLLMPLNPPGQGVAAPSNELPMPATGVPDGLWYATYYHNRVLITDTSRSHLYYDLWFPDGLNYAPVNETLNQGDYSARFDRTEVITVPYNMQMVLTVDDGARVYVDDRLIIDEWHVGPLRTKAATIPMTPGRHSIRLEHFEAGGASTLCFAWRPDYDLWIGRYYTNDRLQGEPLMIRDDGQSKNYQIKFDWVNGGPNNLPPSAVFDTLNYSVKWERTIDFVEGEYEFALKTTGGARVLVDNMPIPGMNGWMNVNPERIVQTCWIKAGHRHVTVDYRNTHDNAHIDFTIKPRVRQLRPQEQRPMTCP